MVSPWCISSYISENTHSFSKKVIIISETFLCAQLVDSKVAESWALKQKRVDDQKNENEIAIRRHLLITYAHAEEQRNAA